MPRRPARPTPAKPVAELSVEQTYRASDPASNSASTWNASYSACASVTILQRPHMRRLCGARPAATSGPAI